MLVLTRKTSQKIRIGADITLTVVKVDGNKVRIGIEAPPDVAIYREELLTGGAAPAAKPCLAHELVTA